MYIDADGTHVGAIHIFVEAESIQFITPTDNENFSYKNIKFKVKSNKNRKIKIVSDGNVFTCKTDGE